MDPASIAFAQLAEEYRRAGQFEDAVAVCRTGLTRHPGYLSARVTLGRALLELGELDDAGMELQFVVNSAPENLAAIRGLAEIFQRQGQLGTALEYYRRALALASHDPELEDVVQHISRELGRHQDQHDDPAGLSFEEAHDALVEAAARVPARDEATEPGEPEADGASPAAAFDFDTLLAAMGTPAAPAPVDALLEGTLPAMTHAPALSLPEPEVDAPADPFAALEADLRQYAPEPIGDGRAEVATFGDDTVPGAASEAGGPPDAAGGAEEPGATGPSAFEMPADVVQAAAATAAPWASDEADTVADPMTAVHAPETPPVGAVETAPPAEDPVLDELERWLLVLQERASTSS
jgi:tetratricopeptide (TPR) repeat protein